MWGGGLWGGAMWGGGLWGGVMWGGGMWGGGMWGGGMWGGGMWGGGMWGGGMWGGGMWGGGLWGGAMWGGGLWGGVMWGGGLWGGVMWGGGLWGGGMWGGGMACDFQLGAHRLVVRWDVGEIHCGSAESGAAGEGNDPAPPSMALSAQHGPHSPAWPHPPSSRVACINCCFSLAPPRPLSLLCPHDHADLALRCCLNASQTSQPSQESQQDPAFFTRLGFSPADFAAVAWMSSWALLGEGKGGGGGGEGRDGESMGGGEERKDASEDAGGAAAASGVVPSAAAAAAAAPAAAVAAAAAKRNGTVVGKEVEHKVQVGRACKMLIDAGRLEWLQGRGLGVEYVEYTTVDVSPENRMLLAVGN
ncbi:unnamed protein product [Closterium sp. Yama58-4]|nr:unnamed protein product [Closterium sp. Yama58-4]